MASFEINGLDDLMSQLNALDVERVGTKMLEEAAPILVDAMKSKANQYRRSGSMAESIKASKVKESKDGRKIVVRPTGKDKKGVRNMEKMVYHEYGTSKQTAVPILSPAVRASENKVMEKMQEVFDREVGT